MSKYLTLCIINVLLVSTVFAGSLRVVANPSQRSMATMATDSLNERILLFGGRNYGSYYDQYYNELWSFDLNTETWGLISISEPLPSPRINPGLAYHVPSHQMILFGGRTGITHYNDVWALDLTVGAESWTQLYPSGTPPSPRTEVKGIIDPINNRLILFGGAVDGVYTNETWSLDFNTLTWSQLYPSGSLPAPRSAYAALYDPAEHRMIVFSGTGQPIVSDVWSLDLTYGSENWQQLFPSGGPPQGRAQSFHAFDKINNALIAGFGFDYPGFIHYLSDVWALYLDSLVWHQLVPPGVVEERRGACAAYNHLNGQVVIFGGDHGSSFANTYSLITDYVAVEEYRERIIQISPHIKVSPNPSRLTYHINFTVPFSGTICLKVIDGSGRLVNTLIRNKRNSGNYITQWNGKDSKGRKVPSGTYFICLEIDGKSIAKKVVLVE